jgi:hypothetical protein
MSTVLQPRGPLPARVYWVRRLLVLAVLIGLLGVIGMTVASGGSPDGTEAGGATQSSTSPTNPGETRTNPTRVTAGPTDTATKTAGDRTRGPDGADPTQRKTSPDARPRNDKQSATPAATPTPLAEPTGPCDPAEVLLEISVRDSASGEPNSATLSFTSTTTPACTIGLTAETLEIQVTSGSDIVWSSSDCSAKLPARQVVARLDPPATYPFTWSGHRSTQSCGGPGEVVVEGGYYLRAGLIGGEPAEAYFDVT